MRGLIAVVVILFYSATSAYADIVLNNPKVNGRPVDWCLVPQSNAGSLQRTAFAKSGIWGMLSVFAESGQTSGPSYSELGRYVI